MANSINRGIVYVLKNPMFKDNIVKIGKTQDLVKRMKQLGRGTEVPCPFECYCAYEIDEYHAVEKIIHTAYRSVDVQTDKKNKTKEFFEVNPAKAEMVLVELSKILNGKPVFLDEDKIYTKEQKAILEKENSQEEQKERKKNFKFIDFSIPEGGILLFSKDSDVTCMVTKGNNVIFRNKEYSLSGLTRELMKKLGYAKNKYNGYRYWSYNGEILKDIYDKKYES